MNIYNIEKRLNSFDEHKWLFFFCLIGQFVGAGIIAFNKPLYRAQTDFEWCAEQYFYITFTIWLVYFIFVLIEPFCKRYIINTISNSLNKTDVKIVPIDVDDGANLRYVMTIQNNEINIKGTIYTLLNNFEYDSDLHKFVAVIEQKYNTENKYLLCVYKENSTYYLSVSELNKNAVTAIVIIPLYRIENLIVGSIYSATKK